MTPAVKLSYCRHCLSPIGADASPFDERGAISEGFCCAGCRTVYRLIEDRHMTSYYELRDSLNDSCLLPVQAVQTDFAYLDDPELLKSVSETDTRLRFFLENMHCASCLWLLERLPRLCDDVAWVRVDMSRSTIEIERVKSGSFAKIAQSLAGLGYLPHLVRDANAARVLARNENRRELLRVGVVGACLGNIMILAVSLYAGAGTGFAESFRFLMGFLALPVLTYGAWPFYRNAFLDLRRGTISLDIPIVFALVVGTGMSYVGLFSGRATLYFDSLGMLVFLLLATRLALGRLQRHFFENHGMAELPFALTVRRLTEVGAEELVSASSLKKGDCVRVLNGMIPADGLVLSGSGFMSRAMMTGEAEPKALNVGDRVEAGSTALSGDWVLKVIAPHQETRMAGILRDAEIAVSSKTRLSLTNQRVARVFIVVVCFSMLAVIAFFARTNWQIGVERALLLAIVTCPCVFGMAIPLLDSLALMKASGRGILVKSSEVFERVARVRHAFFDKTGTLTTGQFAVRQTQIRDASPVHLKAALALESESRHPVALSFTNYFRACGVESLSRVKNFQVLTAGGVSGEYENRQYEIRPTTSTSGLSGNYALYCDGTAVREFELEDALAPTSTKVIHELENRGIGIEILSGDHPAVVDECAFRLGLRKGAGFGGLTPEEKADVIYEEPLPSLMIGDGVNDALAMGAASVSVAVQGSLEASLRTCDVYLLKADLGLVDQLIDIGCSRARAGRICFATSVTYNLVAGGLAIAGMMSPLWAAILMPLSGLSILGIAIGSLK